MYCVYKKIESKDLNMRNQKSPACLVNRGARALNFSAAFPFGIVLRFGVAGI
jgi:hypothetical protein